ncbi:hypothetical protein AGMMS49521_0950 [Campylobacterota bacterium]|nr:hypothetical protein AGMMS49521_0950 [Campylobacterota bacterium]
MRLVLTFILAVGVALAAEPSAFRAGSLSTNDPYGLSESEQAIRANQKSITSLEKRVFAVEQQLDKLNDLLEGLSSATRSNGEAINAIKQSLAKTDEAIKQLTELDEKNKAELAAINARQDKLEKQVNTTLSAQAENQKKLTEAIAATVTKAQFDKTIKQLSAEVDTNRKALQATGAIAAAPENPFDKAQPDALLNEAKKQIGARDYDNATARLLYLIDKKHKVAESTYHLGTIYYFKEQSDKAIAAFKQSASLDESATHMPVLLFYTAISHERLKRNAEARKFYETLISLYPDHSVVESAKKRLAKLPKT